MKTKKQTDHEYYMKNRDKIIKQTSVYGAKHKDRKKELYKTFKSNSSESRRKRYLKQTYGLSPEDYEEIKQIQGGVCAVCFKMVNRLVVDHDHTTGKVRSLLCTTCNAGLGQFKDDIDLLNKAITYLKHFGK